MRQVACSESGAVCLGGPTYPRQPWGSVTRQSDVPSRKQSQVGAVQCASVGRRALAVRGAVWLRGPTYPHESASRAKAGQCASVGRRTLATRHNKTRPTKGNFENAFNQRSPDLNTRFKVTFWRRTLEPDKVNWQQGDAAADDANQTDL